MKEQGSQQLAYRLLIVDDEAPVREVLLEILETTPYEVEAVADGQEALEKWSHQSYDLMIVDIRMPRMDGETLIRELRKTDWDIALIVLTGHGELSLAYTLLKEYRIADFLYKPLDHPAQLMFSVENALEKRRLRQQAEQYGEQLAKANAELTETNKHLEQEVIERKRIEEELRVLNQQLEEASRLKNEFLANMSHELRTPLNAMIGYTSMTLKALKDSLPAKHLQNLIKAEQSARMLLQLITDILDFSKIEAGEMDTVIEEVDIGNLIEEVFVNTEGLLSDKPIKLEYDIDSELPFVKNDYIKIKQILNNLVGNAIKFTHTGYVAVRAKPVENETAAFIEVEDSGKGIPPEKLAHIFESFRQADSSTKKEFAGTGLGLAITKKLCKSLGIEIGVRSEVGKGTTFWINIPAHYRPSESQAGQESESEEEFLLGPSLDVKASILSVLVIDDNEMNLDLMADVFEEAGYAVYKSLSGQEGVELAKKTVPDVILTDLAMPEMDGFEVTELLKQHPNTAEITIIGCSAFATKEFKNRALQAGCDGYITKPIEPEHLVEQVMKIVLTSKVKKGY